MKRVLTLTTVLVAMVVLASTTLAGPWGGRFYGMGPALSNLTPEQSAKILALQQAHLEKVTPIQEELFKKKMELRSLWASQNPDQARINALQKEIFDLVDQLHQESMALRSEILKVIQSP
jgi:Spy/CpxP family protein refolding chaperone